MPDGYTRPLKCNDCLSFYDAMNTKPLQKYLLIHPFPVLDILHRAIGMDRDLGHDADTPWIGCQVLVRLRCMSLDTVGGHWSKHCLYIYAQRDREISK